MIEALGSALELYNDSESRQKALGYQETFDRLSEEIDNLDPQADDYQTRKTSLQSSMAQARKRYDAWRGRIRTKVFELPDLKVSTPSSS